MRLRMMFSVLAIAVSMLCVSGCESKAGTGFLAGGATGAVVGGVVGGGAGAAIGAGAGALTGGIIGAVLDSRDQRNLESQSPKTARRIDSGKQLTVDDVISLHDASISDDKIIELMQKTNSRYYLKMKDIDKLQRAGVSNSVINYMMRT